MLRQQHEHIVATLHLSLEVRIVRSGAGQLMKDVTSLALLWIDDEITRDSAVVRLLELEGYKVDCAVSGTAGLAMARAGEYQGILLDLRLPIFRA